MPFGIRIDAEAEAKIRELQSEPLVLSALFDALDKLAEDPLAMSRKSGFPYVQGGMLYLTDWIECGDQTVLFTVRWVWHPNEQDIWVHFIRVERL